MGALYSVETLWKAEINICCRVRHIYGWNKYHLFENVIYLFRKQISRAD